MEISKNNFFGKISFLALGSILKFLVQLFVIILFSKILSLADYGKYQEVFMYINFFSTISLFGLPTILLLHSTDEIFHWIKANKKTIFIFLLTIYMLSVGYILILLPHFILVEKLLLIGVLILQNVLFTVEAISLYNKKENKIFYANIFYSITYLILHLLSIKYFYSLHFILIGLIIITFLKIVFLVKNLFIQNKFTQHYDETIRKQWVCIGLNDVSGIAVKWIDKWVVLLILPITQFAVYFNGTYEVPIFMLILTAIGNVMLVNLSNDSAINTEKIKALFFKSTLIIAAIVFPCFFFLLFNCDAVFHFLFGNKYDASIHIFKVSLFILPIRIFNSTVVLQANKKNETILKGSLLDFIIALCLIFILYPLYHLQGLALAFVLSTYVQVMFYLYKTARLIHKKITYFIPIKQLLVLLATSTFIMVTSKYLLQHFSTLIQLVVSAICCFFLIITALFFAVKKYSSTSY